MSAGATFKLIANDGKADRMIMASELLNKRIKEVMCYRHSHGYADPTPTLVDVERTHILFVNAHFKPFAAIGYEYNKLPNQGSPRYDVDVSFPIPQFGDFFADMCLHLILPQETASTGTAPVLALLNADATKLPFNRGMPGFGAGADPNSAGNQFVYTTAASGHGTPATQYGGANTAAALTIPGIASGARAVYKVVRTELVDFAGRRVAEGAAGKNFVRYAEFIGERICEKTEFIVNGTALDSYSSDDIVMHRKVRIPPHKLLGWKRLVGQEVPVEAYTDFIGIDAQSVFPSHLQHDAGDATTGDFNTGLSADAMAQAPSHPMHTPLASVSSGTRRMVCQVVSGPQTPKLVQPALDLLIPLLFWFNLDSRLAIPSVSIPYGMRSINVKFAKKDTCLFTAPGALFRKDSYINVHTNDGTGTAILPTKAAEIDVFSVLTPVLYVDSAANTSANEITKAEIYNNNIFVNPEVHDIYIRRIGFSLIRVYRAHTEALTTTTPRVLLHQLKWPIESMRVAVRPDWNNDPKNPNQYRDWHNMCRVYDRVDHLPSRSEGWSVGASAGTVPVTSSILNSTDADATNVPHITSVASGLRLTTPEYRETIQTLMLEAHGITISQEMNSNFYRDYLGYVYGGTNMMSPEDLGVVNVLFCLHPFLYQPSGHINVSRSREFYISFRLDADACRNPATGAFGARLIISATAINFLLISDGSATLRYTT